MYEPEGKLAAPPGIAALNATFVAARERAKNALLSGQLDGLGCAQEITSATDTWIAEVWREAADGQGIDARIVALGGYGRRELCFASDVDLVIEVGDSVFESAELRDAVERFIAWCREPRVKVAHAVRTASQLEHEFQSDIRTAVAYLDARPLASTGDDSELYDLATRFLSGNDAGMRFVQDLLEGYRVRHKRFGQTIYRLEPELKSGPGGLRDLHAIRWAALVRWGFDPGCETRDEEGWTATHLQDYEVGREWIITLRHHLHLAHGRKHDRLNFPDQESLAQQLVPEVNDPRKATEVMMREHYTIANSIDRHTERMLRRWGQHSQPFKPIGSRFRLGGGQLGVDDPDVPISKIDVLEALELASLHDALLEPTLETAMEESIGRWSDVERGDVELMTRFRRLLTGDVSRQTSMRFLDLGLMTAGIPEFGPVVCHVQHDVYHVYTTDVHLVRCLEAGRSLLDGDEDSIAERWKMFGHLASNIQDREVFLLACLLHDVAKNRGGGHSEKGASMMLDIGPRLGLNELQTELLSFLVREHLLLSKIARRRDTSDPRVVRRLASTVRTRQTLELLTCLTACDMAVVGDDVLNDWNASLILQLHGHVSEVLEHGGESRWYRVEEAVEGQKRALLALVATDETVGRGSAVDAFIRDLPAGHVVETSPQELARQFDVYDRARKLDSPLVQITPNVARGSTEVMVATQDAPGTLSKITGTISSLGLNILAAQIITTASGRTLDILYVAQSGGAPNVLSSGTQHPLTDPRRIATLSARLDEVLAGEVFVEDLLAKRLAERRLARRPTPLVATEVAVISDDSEFTVVEVKAPDRIGLLYDIAAALQAGGVNVHFSKVDSLGTQVIDTFYVEELDGGRLTAEREAELVASISKALIESKLAQAD